MTKYIITALCNPYNARTHYNGQRVLRYDMTTPIKWVNDDFYGAGLTLEEAMDILDRYANELGDDIRWVDDANLAEDVRYFKEEEGIDLDTSWYKGEGWYRDEYQVYKRGDMYLQDDVMCYAIEEMDCYKEEYADYMDYTSWTIEQFKALPEPSSFTNEEVGLVEGLIIMPTDKLHESGYRLMEFVTIQDGVPTYRVSGCSDVLHLGGIGGYNIGRYNCDNMDMLIHREMMPRIAWKIDCLPISGLVRLFCGKKMYLGESLSEMGLFVIEDKTNGEV